jgi:hypothetical protein
MEIRQAGWLVLAMFLVGCGVNRYELYQRLPEKDKELFARTKQFMTDNQQERFLLLKDSVERERMVEELHIQDRLLKFQPYIRDAIMAGRVVPGMSAEAVLLSWGRPREIDRRDIDGVPSECWFYTRGERDGQAVDKKVLFLKGMVTEVASGN